MKIGVVGTVIWSLSLLMVASGANSQEKAGALTVTVNVSGTVLDGPPQFELKADGLTIGTGTLALPADVEQSFKFEVPDGNAIEQLAISFTNDRYVEGLGDRNLFIHSVVINGARYAGSTLQHLPALKTSTAGDVLRIFSSGEATVSRPVGGWPPSDAGSTEAVDAPSPVTVPICNESELAILGFENAGFIVTGEARKEIAGFVMRVGPGCSYEVVGYSSAVGPRRANEWMAAARADAVAALIAGGGVDKARIVARGGGATSEFGKPAQNRRVTITARTPDGVE